jgi:tetratricopeptide (TPR) repeat protein
MRRMAIALILVLVTPAAYASAKSRGALKPSARKLLERADALHRTKDNPGALQAYIDAVKADPRAADLDAIERYSSPFRFSQYQRVKEKKRAALRQYLSLHPADWPAAKKLVALAVDEDEAEAIIAPFTKSRPEDADVYATRAHVRENDRRWAPAVADYQKATALAPQNGKFHLWLALTESLYVAKDPTLTEADKRQWIQQALAENDRGEALEPGTPVAMMTRGDLLKEQAKLERDPEVQKKLLAESQAAAAVDSERLQQRLHHTPQTLASESPADWQQVTSSSGTFEYRLPAGWQKDSFNSYRGEDREVLEQIYPDAPITREYCRSFRMLPQANAQVTVVDTLAYGNGHVSGCFLVTDYANTDTNKTFRHTSFRFPTSRGIEDITVIEPQNASHKASLAKTIVDSVRTK